MSRIDPIARAVGRTIVAGGVVALAGLAGCKGGDSESSKSADQPSAGASATEPSAGGAAAGERAPEAAGKPSEAPGGAQPANPQGAAPTPAAGGNIEVTDEKLQAFADAYLEAQKVQKKLKSELQAAKSNKEAQAIQGKAVKQIREKVESTGMSFETYGAIGRQIEQDPELRKRLREKIEAGDSAK